MRFKLKRRLIHYFVKFFIEFRKLGSLGHDILLHEERSLKLLESSLAKEGETIVDQSKVKIDTGIGQEVATVTSDVGTTLLIITVQACQDFVMRKNVGLLDWLNTFVVVSANDFVVVLKVQMCFRSKPIRSDSETMSYQKSHFYLIHGGRNGRVDNVANGTKLGLPNNLCFLRLCNKFILGLCQLLLFGNKLSGIFFGLELFTNFLLNFIDLLIYLVAFEINFFQVVSD